MQDFYVMLILHEFTLYKSFFTYFAAIFFRQKELFSTSNVKDFVYKIYACGETSILALLTGMMQKKSCRGFLICKRETSVINTSLMAGTG